VAVLDSAGTWQVLDQTNSVLRGIGNTERFVAISDIVRDRDDLMWVCNVKIGLAVFDGFPPERSRMYGQSALGLPPRRDIGEMDIDPDGIKWISTPLDGFILFDDGGTPFEAGDEFALSFNTLSESRMTSNRTSDIMVDRTGGIWVATDNGLNVVHGTYSRAARSFRLDEWRVYNTANGLAANAVTALEEDARGNIWVGTEDGLAQIDPAGEVAFTLTTGNSGLIDNRINSLLFDADTGTLWIGTLDGLAILRVERGRDPNADAVAVYPNPLRLGRRGSEMTFAGLPLGAALEIFALDGRLVRHIDGTPGQGTILWNGQNDAGFLVGSGIYLFVARNEAGSTVRGKFAVVNIP
jgi:ligand-binding sensor domain-containing protein